MNSTHKKCLLAIAFFMYQQISMAQVAPESSTPIFTADSLLSGNTKDILTDFFQLGLNNLIGANREFNFTSSPFALMLKKNPGLSIDLKYKKNRPLRKLNFSFGIKLDSSFNFNGLSSGIKYSLINQRDFTTSKLISESLKGDAFQKERGILNKELDKCFDINFPGNVVTPEAQKFNNNINDLFNKDIPLNQFDAGFQEDVIKIVKKSGLSRIKNIIDNHPNLSFKVINARNVDSLKNSIKNNLLWTIGISDTTYKDKFQFSNVLLVSELSKGIFYPKPGENNLEINAKASYNFLNDNLQKTRNLKREIFAIEGGINWVIRDRATDKSFFELKLSTSYYHNFAGLHAKEERDRFTLNITPRIRIYEDVWLPFEIRYDPTTGNLLGFLNVKANFTGLGKLIKGGPK